MFYMWVGARASPTSHYLIPNRRVYFGFPEDGEERHMSNEVDAMQVRAENRTTEYGCSGIHAQAFYNPISFIHNTVIWLYLEPT
jgi:hypothetical protein